MGINKLAQESQEVLTLEAAARKMRAAYAALTMDAEESRVETYLLVQSEVITREPV